ncbi:unnamed protein product [Arabidopsis arenosa]|uniref:Protein kinase domain-containing protein n=1 Tax=Arabidopsis arenosa TaxID=38785 RepID=A0A8S2A1R0_ARAAE|nr:unnamed protein product [Arabidopsis arenosa]
MNRRKQVKRRVGKYEVGRTIGEGTFAKVKFARNSETGEPVALKILDKDKVLNHKMAEQVMASKTKIFIIFDKKTRRGDISNSLYMQWTTLIAEVSTIETLRYFI